MRIYSNVYNCDIYLSYYEDKYFTSFFAHFKHAIKIYYHDMYTQIIIKKFNDKCLEMHFLREHF